MNRRIGLAVLLAVLVVLAGCSGGGTTTGTPTDAGTPEGTPTPTPTPYPDGYGEGGVTDEDAAVAAHESAVLATSGFRIDYQAVINTTDATTRVDYTQQVETASKEVLLNTNITGGGFSGSVTQYYNNDTVYKKTYSSQANRTSYSNKSVEYNLSSFTGARFVRPVLADVTYGQSEVTTYQGTKVVRYTDASLQNATSLLGRQVSPENVTSFSASFVVDRRGVVRHVEYTATIDTGDGERRLSVAIDVTTGDTTVARPDWVAKA